MKETIQNWFGQIPALPGLAACWVRFSDRQCLSVSHSPNFPTAGLETVVQHLVEAASGMHSQRITATRLQWSFAKGKIHFVTRPDGICFGLITPTEGEELMPPIVEGLVGEFLELRAA